jgi:hypothetical protein
LIQRQPSPVLLEAPAHSQEERKSAEDFSIHSGPENVVSRLLPHCPCPESHSNSARFFLSCAKADSFAFGTEIGQLNSPENAPQA